MDIRNFDNSLSELHGHSDSVTQLKWNPKCHNILGSSSSDHLVKLHDMSNDSTIFTHLGHMLNDFDWSYADPWMVASVADDNFYMSGNPPTLLQTNLNRYLNTTTTTTTIR